MTEHLWFGIFLTLACWFAASRLRAWSGMALLDPVLVTVTVIIAILLILDIPYENYDRGGRVISFLLGPAVVALAVPFCREIKKVRSNLAAVLASVSAGAVVGIASASGIVYLLGGSRESIISVAPKSVTSPIAMQISAVIGGTPPLTVGIVLITGILGGMLGPELLRLVGIKDDFSTGIALGTAAHGIGTSRGFRESGLTGAMSGVGMTLNGVITAALLGLLAWVS
jgi:predicted murein hydrolase (TIGR00659 family)